MVEHFSPQQVDNHLTDMIIFHTKMEENAVISLPDTEISFLFLFYNTNWVIKSAQNIICTHVKLDVCTRHKGN